MLNYKIISKREYDELVNDLIKQKAIFSSMFANISVALEKLDEDVREETLKRILEFYRKDYDNLWKKT